MPVVPFSYLQPLDQDILVLGRCSWHVKGGTRSLLCACVAKWKQRLHTAFQDALPEHFSIFSW